MKAMVYNTYGDPDVLHIEEIEKPVPKDNEVLVKVHATTVTSGEVMLRSGAFPPLFWLPGRLMLGFTKPKRTILGYEFAGEIESAGKDVKLFKAGDKVFGTTTGLSAGAYAEYLCLPEKWAQGVMALKPANISYDEAAAGIVGGLTALYFLKKGNIGSGQKILIYGASGSIGTYAIQLAKYFGAEVTGVCSTANLGLVKSLGAGKVIDYTKEDFTKNGETYDIIFDTVNKNSFTHSIKSVEKNGYYILAGIGLPHLFGKLWLSITGSKKVICDITKERNEDLIFLRDLIEAGKIKSVIEKRYTFEQIPEAHSYAGKGHKKGNVVITMA